MNLRVFEAEAEKVLSQRLFIESARLNPRGRGWCECIISAEDVSVG